MKKLFCMLLIAVMLVGCGDPMVISVDGKAKEYPTYGFLNQNTSKSDKVCYDLIMGNVIWSVILGAGIIFPAYFVGFSIYEPIGPKDTEGKCPTIDS